MCHKGRGAALPGEYSIDIESQGDAGSLGSWMRGTLVGEVRY